MPASEKLTPGQRAYEERRAARAGMSLEKWLAAKDRDAQAETRALEKQAKVSAKKAKPPGLISRLLDRAHKPL